MTSSARTGEGADVEIVKWYTHARRFPQLIGKTADGATIWGGPYTFTQVTAGVVLLIAGSKTAWLWGHFGLVANTLILLGGTYAVVLGIGRLPIGARNPMSVAAGALRAVSVPPQGRLRGAPVRRPKPPHLLRSPLVISPEVPVRGAGCGGVGEHQVGAGRRPRTGPQPARSSLLAGERCRTGGGSRSDADRLVPALTGVQLLLASTTTAQAAQSLSQEH